MAPNTKNRLLLIERVLLLKSVSIFSETPETILAEIAYLMQEEMVAGNKPIVVEGEAGNCMYIIFSGGVKVEKGGQLLASLKDREFFGELSLLDTETRSASVTSTSDCLLFRIDQEPFYDLIECRPEVVKGVIQNLCKRLRAANHKVWELSKTT